MLLKLEKCIPISPVTLETVPKYANIERPTSSQLYASSELSFYLNSFFKCGISKNLAVIATVCMYEVFQMCIILDTIIWRNYLKTLFVCCDALVDAKLF